MNNLNFDKNKHILKLYLYVENPYSINIIIEISNSN